MVLAGQFGGYKQDSKQNIADGTNQPTFHPGTYPEPDPPMPQTVVFAEVFQGPQSLDSAVNGKPVIDPKSSAIARCKGNRKAYG
jgi:hypothetical protein